MFIKDGKSIFNNTGLVISIIILLVLLIFSYNKNNDSHLVQFKPDIFSFVICRIFLFCQDLQKIFTTLYFISFFVQFFIFFKLDKNFKQGLSFKIV